MKVTKSSLLIEIAQLRAENLRLNSRVTELVVSNEFFQNLLKYHPHVGEIIALEKMAEALAQVMTLSQQASERILNAYRR